MIAMNKASFMNAHTQPIPNTSLLMIKESDEDWGKHILLSHRPFGK